MKYICLPRRSGKPDTIMDLITEIIEKEERFIVLNDMNYLDITKRLEKLRKDRVKINREIYDLENLKSRKLSEDIKWNAYEKEMTDWKDYGTTYPNTIRW
ncbi:hypothetical protein WGM54_14705 [Paenibacillus polymyxa]|uniref:hypothetical protein n=1 Tax=Paenibacillus polymyxa TaxID=1406 RepID=UPI00307DA5E0